MEEGGDLIGQDIQEVNHVFSRLKNENFVELQRGWPAYVKDDGLKGLTVDPALFKTYFGTI